MKILNLGNESIAFQTGAFYQDLILIVKEMHESKVNSSEMFAPFGTRLERCINKHTGIATYIQAAPTYDNACIALPGLTKGHVLNSREFGKWIAKNFNADNISFLNLEKKGWVDPANSRVGGAFSEIVFRMYIGHYFVQGRGYGAEEVAATILHEVGHAFTFLQFLADTVVVNHVMQRVHQELTTAGPDKKVKIILSKAAADMNIKNREWIETLEDSTDATVVMKVLATAVAIEPRKVDNKVFFSMDSCEELADIFAIRHGAGKAILQARSKWGRVRNQDNYGILSGIGYALGSLGCIVAVATGAAAGAVPAALFLSLVFSANSAINLAPGVSAAANMNDVTGFKREAAKVRNQFVEQLKQSKLPKEDVAAILENINLADRMIQEYQTNDIEPAMAVKFFDMFRRGKMDARASREYTDVLEQLVSNDLFIRAAQLANR